MAKIVVENGEWDDARKKLKSSLDAQQAAFNANLKAAFPQSASAKPPPSATAPPAAKPPVASRLSTSTKSSRAGLPSSRLS